ncbi:MAG: FtsX-like permease family protein [Candidatus Thorarchaeota archaeon]
MAVVSKIHNGHSVRQRIVVTLICLTLATTLVSSISLYVDSASVDEWNQQIEIGPVSMMVSGDGVEGVLDEIAEIPGVTNVSGLDSAHGYLTRRNVIYGFETSGNVYTLSDDYMEKFPTTFTIARGRWPQNESEIAIPVSLANQAFIGPGWQVNYSFGLSYPLTLLTVVGTYEQSSGDLYSHYYYSSMAVVVKSRLDVNTTSTRAYLNVDQTPLSPFDANGALRYLSDIGDEIRNLYPGYPEEVAFSGYNIYDYLSSGIRSYIYWRTTARNEQIVRSAGVILVVLLMVILAVQYNLSDRKYESSFLRARGATERRIELLIIREVLSLAALSGLLGFFFGIITSRIALISTAYLRFDFALILTSPLLLTQDTVLFIILLSFALPSMAYAGLTFAAAGRKRVEEGKGRLGKLSKGMKIVRWDMGILIISLALMFAFYTSSSVVQRNPVYSLILPYLPIPVYLAVGNLVMKGLQRGADVFSRIAGRPLGKIPASIGVRRIAKSSRTAGLVIMVIVLAITLSWNNAIADTSLPETRENHAKFAIGGDIVFHLKKDHSIRWQEFTDNVTSREQVTTSTIVSMRKLFLSSGYSGAIDFVIMRPEEYRFVGYDQFGDRLNESSLGNLLLEMSVNPTAAIITQDLADEYQVSAGDSFRAFKTQSDIDYFTFTILAVVETLTHPLIPESTYIPESEGYAVGSRLIWINSFYATEKLDLIEDTYSYLTVATCDSCNDTELAMSLLETGGEEVIHRNDWATVDNELDSYVATTLYKMDRSVDSMLSIASVFVVIGVMIVYGTESLRGRKRDVALLRSLGADGMTIARAQVAELVFLIILSIGLLLLYSPLFVANSLIASISNYSSWSFLFPIPMFVTVPWVTLIIVLSFYLICMFALIVVIGLLSTRIELRKALSSSWTKGGPFTECDN